MYKMYFKYFLKLPFVSSVSVSSAEDDFIIGFCLSPPTFGLFRTGAHSENVQNKPVGFRGLFIYSYNSHMWIF